MLPLKSRQMFLVWAATSSHVDFHGLPLGAIMVSVVHVALEEAMLMSLSCAATEVFDGV